MQAPLFWAYVRMMDRIVSERSLSDVYETAAGTGSLKESDQRAYMNDLRRHAEGLENERRLRRRRSHKASLKDIAALKIKVKLVGDGKLDMPSPREARVARQAERRKKLLALESAQKG